MDDSELFLQATKEVESSKQVKTMWAKAMALADGDSEKAKYRYIRMRVEHLTNEKSDASLSKDDPDPGRPSLSEGLHEKQKSELKRSPTHQLRSTGLSEMAMQDEEHGSLEGQSFLGQGPEKGEERISIDPDGPVEGSGKKLSVEADQKKKEFYKQRAEERKKRKRIQIIRLVVTCFFAGFGLAFFVEQRGLNAAGIGSGLGASVGLAIIPLIFSLISIRAAWIAFAFVLLSALFVGGLEDRDSEQQAAIEVLRNRMNRINASLPIMLNDHLKLVGMRIEVEEDKHWVEIRTEIVTDEKRDLNFDEIKGPISDAYQNFLCAADWVQSTGVVNVKYWYYDKYERFIGTHPARIVACRNR